MSALHPADPDAIPAFMEWEPPTEYYAPVLWRGETPLKAWQAGRCGICGVGRDFYGRRHALDHDHDTGLVRGYLCTACNLREGLEPGGAFNLWRTGSNPCAMFGWLYLYMGSGYTPKPITVEQADAIKRRAAEREAAIRAELLKPLPDMPWFVARAAS